MTGVVARMLRGWFVIGVATVSMSGLAATAAASVATAAPTPAAPTPVGAIKILAGDGSGSLRGGGSATGFIVELPSGAACPGDTMHQYYLVDSYVEPVGVSLSTIRFPDGYPTKGSDLVSADGTPYVAQNTDPFTARIEDLPLFNWSVYAHQSVLPPGTYNVGVVCSNRYSDPTSYWNTQITFTASTTDKGGFTWLVGKGSSFAGGSSAGGSSAGGSSAGGSSAGGSSAGGSSVGVVVGVVAAVLVLAATALVFVRRGRRRTRSSVPAGS